MVPNVGGMLAYYLFYLDKVEAFPEGFMMLAGDTRVRNFTGPFPDEPLSSWPTDPSDQFFLEQRAIGFNCLNYDKDPEPSLYRHQFPDKAYMDANCKDGIRLEMAFPSCGNGQLDSPDHRSHVKYPSLVKEGNCPEGYDHHYPFLFYETIWATNKFAGKPGQFLVSTGDPVGTSYHADFIMGWESTEFLQQAVNTCTSQSGKVEDCPLFHLQSDADAAKCQFSMPGHLEGEDCAGPRDGLPVNVPIQYGPEPATKYPVAGAMGNAGNVPTSYLPKTATPATFANPTLTYSPANPSGTGAIGVAPADQPHSSSPLPPAPPAYQTHSSSSSPPPPPPPAYQPPHSSSTSPLPPAPPAVTQPPAGPPKDTSPNVSTTCITKGNEVIEVVVEEVDVTVTATATTYVPPPAPPSYHHKRHGHGHRQ
jgi:hypothetical protein